MFSGGVSGTSAYDLLNTTLVPEEAVEETALPVGGKKRNLSRKLRVDFFCQERFGLSTGLVDGLLREFASAIPQ